MRLDDAAIDRAMTRDGAAGADRWRYELDMATAGGPLALALSWAILAAVAAPAACDTLETVAVPTVCDTADRPPPRKPGGGVYVNSGIPRVNIFPFEAPC